MPAAAGSPGNKPGCRQGIADLRCLCRRGGLIRRARREVSGLRVCATAAASRSWSPVFRNVFRSVQREAGAPLVARTLPVFRQYADSPAKCLAWRREPTQCARRPACLPGPRSHTAVPSRIAPCSSTSSPSAWHRQRAVGVQAFRPRLYGLVVDDVPSIHIRQCLKGY